MIQIVLNQDKSLIITKNENIYQYEQKATQLEFYLPKIIDNIDIFECIVSLRLLYPSGNGESIIITNSVTDKSYEDKICYFTYLPRNATLLPGIIEICLSIVSKDGKQILKTSTNQLYVLETIDSDDIISDDDMDQLDWITAQISDIRATKADNIISYVSENAIQLEAEGNPIGDKVTLPNGSCDDVIIFGDDGNIEPTPDEYDGVIEF